ncbi:MAG TPA: hypothetical protein VF762_21550 [Blastocatellia bacterium]|jgi:hypothetical protein
MRRHLVRVIVLSLALCVPAAAQSKGPTNGERSKLKIVDSSAQFWMGAIFDYFSSKGLREANSILRNGDGRLSGPRFFTINAGIFGLTLAFQSKYPRAMNWMRRAAGWAHFAVAIGNNRIGVKK